MSHIVEIPKRLKLEDYFKARDEQVNSPLNRHGATQALGREATWSELFIHWETNGGKELFDRTFPWFA